MHRILLQLLFAAYAAASLAIQAAQRPVPERQPQGPPSDMVLIPAGQFSMGSYDGEEDEEPVHLVYLDAFYIDKYEVTNADYKKFLDATGHRKPYNWIAGLYPEGKARHPVTLVSWDDANAYASWVGKRLPTEAEWEKAARGKLANKKFPWGDEAKPEHARFNSKDGTAEIGQYPPNGFGLYDIAGNVWEWCSDWYDAEYYLYSPERNPKGPESGLYRVLRGSCWFNSEPYLRVTYRGWSRAQELNLTAGIRCARSSPEGP